MTIDIRAQLESQVKKNNNNEAETAKLKQQVADLISHKEILRRDLVKARALFDAAIQRQNENLMSEGNTGQRNKVDLKQEPGDEEFNEKFIRTLGLVKWKGEEPAWFKLDFLERMKRLDPKDTEGIQTEYARLSEYKGELASKLDRVQGLLKATVDEENKKEQEHLMLMKRKEHEELRLKEKRKDLEALIAKLGAFDGQLTVGRNPRTNEEVYMNDGASVFSLDKSDVFKIEEDENLLDVYLEKLELNPTIIEAVMGSLDIHNLTPSQMVTVITTSFFDHPAISSMRLYGTSAQIDSQSTFSFVPDSFFIDYCRSNAIVLDLYYTNDKGLLVKYAKAEIELQQLIEQNLKDGKENYIGVVNSFAKIQSIHQSKEFLGLIKYRLKPRMPIFNDIVRYNKLFAKKKDIKKYAYDSKYIDRIRRLNVKVCNGYGFPDYGEIFISFKFMNFDVPRVKSGRNHEEDPRGQSEVRPSQVLRVHVHHGNQRVSQVGKARVPGLRRHHSLQAKSQ
jgi:hypothetical protein